MESRGAGHPVTVFEGGTVRTMDSSRPIARSLVVEGDRIVALDESPAGARRIDLQGGCLLPGFTDSHVHFPTWALTRRELQLRGSRDDVLALVAETVPRVQHGRWLRGFGWTDLEPSLEALDAVTGDVPTALLAHDWHSLWVNSAALAHAQGDLERPGGEVDVQAGVLREEAAWSFRDRFTLATHEELVEATRAALPAAAARGVTAIHCKDGLIGSREVYAELELPFRVWQSLPAKRLDERPDYVKAYMDGTLGSQTARLLDGSGVEITSRDEFEEIVRAATAAGVPVAVHAIGDLANREALDVFEAVADAVRPRIEHAQCLHPDDIPRFAALGVTASIQPSMAVSDEALAERLWAGRLDGAYAYRSLHASGARLALGSDAPVEEMDPLQGLRDAVLREWRSHEALHLQAALEALTVTPAWLEGNGELRGQLRPGRLADLVILDRDPFDDLENATVADTWVSGRSTVDT
jgi:predicted amidohydrolase YtcJ